MTEDLRTTRDEIVERITERLGVIVARSSARIDVIRQKVKSLRMMLAILMMTKNPPKRKIQTTNDTGNDLTGTVNRG